MKPISEYVLRSNKVSSLDKYVLQSNKVSQINEYLSSKISNKEYGDISLLAMKIFTEKNYIFKTERNSELDFINAEYKNYILFKYGIFGKNDSYLAISYDEFEPIKGNSLMSLVDFGKEFMKLLNISGTDILFIKINRYIEDNRCAFEQICSYNFRSKQAKGYYDIIEDITDINKESDDYHTIK